MTTAPIQSADLSTLREKALRDEHAAFKAKSIARGKLLERFRCYLQEVVDKVSDEGDRVYFGSTSHFEYLKDIVNEMDMWSWDAIARERPEIDPYAEMRALRVAVEATRLRIEALEAENKRLRERYENWQPIVTPPHPSFNPRALLEFYCVSEAEEDWMSPETFITAIWDERPDTAVYWCAIVSPEIRPDHFAALSGKEGQS